MPGPAGPPEERSRPTWPVDVAARCPLRLPRLSSICSHSSRRVPGPDVHVGRRSELPVSDAYVTAGSGSHGTGGTQQAVAGLHRVEYVGDPAGQSGFDLGDTEQ